MSKYALVQYYRGTCTKNCASKRKQVILEVRWSSASVDFRITKALSCSCTDEHGLDGGGHLGDLHADVRRIAGEGPVEGAHKAGH